MNITWFLPTNSIDYNAMSASIWIRALQLLPYLSEHDVHSSINDFEKPSDIAIFVRFQSDEAFEIAKKQKQKGSKIIFDLCVNYFDESSAPGLGDPVTQRHINECLRMVALADAITCASKNIKLRADDFHHESVYIPDSINPEHFSYRKKATDFSRDIPRAIWSGVSTKASDLLPHMHILESYKIPLRIIAEKRPKEFGVPFLFRKPKSSFSRWSYESFPRNIQRGDFCFAPRDVGTTYNQGHSFFKIGVFLVQGIPVLASPVPSYFELLGEGKGGRICQSRDEFKTAIEEILENPAVLHNWSSQAIEIMKPYYTSEISKHYFALFKKLLNV